MGSYDEMAFPDLVVHNPAPGVTPDFEGIKQAISIHRSGYPDMHFVVEDQVAEGAKVLSRWTVAGTHKCEWVGISPTGKQISVHGMSLQRWQGGRMIEVWLAMDMLGWMQQLGVIPPRG